MGVKMNEAGISILSAEKIKYDFPVISTPGVVSKSMSSFENDVAKEGDNMHACSISI